MRRLAWVLVACVVLAGCAGTTPETTDPTASTAGTPDLTTVPETTATDGTAVDRPEGRAATVTEVVDGDTVEIRHPNGTTDTVRLLGIDTPEVHVENDPPEFEGVPDTEAGRTCLRDAGRNASAFVERLPAGERVRLVIGGDRRGRYGRLLAFVRQNGTNVNYRLVAEGYARVYDTSFAGRERFDRAEARAQRNRLGLWACAADGNEPEPSTGERPEPGGLAIVEIEADAPGNDNANPNGERIVLENGGEKRLALGGWTVSDAADHTYTFPRGVTLGPGERVTLHTGAGSDSPSELYWGASEAVWNNDGDTVTVRNATGETVAERSYG